MLPKSHRQELLSWLELLKSLEKLFCDEKDNFKIVKNQWHQIQDYLQTKIMTVDSGNLEISEQFLFQSWQTETYRYIRLLKTDFLFYQSAKQVNTKHTCFLTIKQRLNDTIKLTENYLIQITLSNEN
ncbi:hypothetical protein GM3708_2686 [Geminocystis sp. NIES-3708]|uniref:heterocyst frequency control protein PatD n=1 Tax=Geminocystis sp. NIES-3708 TaxID=1615909 RepID=UPI0005FC9434|nr:heterocyst frequency control protein PatD [Geminocystis sp. NIES-3708]BAQ62280.1 hypothetical protein GM3708_2686 [Geminocystis sp. NIES-3708]